MQAAEALKLLAGIGSSLAGRLQMLDARTMEWTEIAHRARNAGVHASAAATRRVKLHHLALRLRPWTPSATT